MHDPLCQTNVNTHGSRVVTNECRTVADIVFLKDGCDEERVDQPTPCRSQQPASRFKETTDDEKDRPVTQSRCREEHFERGCHETEWAPRGRRRIGTGGAVGARSSEQCQLLDDLL